ncbi:hypothetical protein [Hymenobacter tenuis]
MYRSYVALCLLWFALCACKKNPYLRGIDQEALFAPPTPAELAAVEAHWASRPLSPRATAWNKPCR